MASEAEADRTRRWARIEPAFVAWQAAVDFPENDPRRQHLTDVYIAQACVKGDQDALGYFEKEVMGEALARLASLRLTRPALDDLRSTVRDLALPPPAGVHGRIAAYGGRGPLVGWLRVVAYREAIRRRELPESASWLAAEHPVQLGTPELDILRARHRDVFREAMQGALEELDERDRGMLRLHYGHGVSMEKLAQAYRVDRSSIWRKLSAAQERIAVYVQRRLGRELQTTASETESIVRVLLSSVESSLSRWLAK